jgi:hypothetical protein
VTRWISVTFALVAAACGGETADTTGATSATSSGAGGSPIDPPPPDAGLGPWKCQPGEVDEGGTCKPAGIAPGACGEGFVHDGVDACQPVLPAEPCPHGTMAIPGETTCRAVSPCGAGPWGDIVRDADTQHVSAAFVGASDGSAAKPWAKIADAVAAAKSGATIAIAAGSYAEEIVIAKKLILWGVCASKVEIVGPATNNALQMVPGADGTIVRGLAVTGQWNAVGIDGVVSVTLREVWLHDVPNLLFYAWSDAPELARAKVIGSLVEGGAAVGLHGHGAGLEVETSLVRDIKGSMINGAGRGIQMVAGSSATPVSLSVTRSLVERTMVQGISVYDSATTIDTTVVRDNARNPELMLSNECISSRSIAGPTPTLTVTRSFLARCWEIGVRSDAGVLTMDAVTMRDVVQGGNGVAVVVHGKAPNKTTIAHSVADGLRGLGYYIATQGPRLDGVVARHIASFDAGPLRGPGVGIAVLGEKGVASEATIHGARIEQIDGAGIVVSEGTATIEGARVESVSFALNPQPLGGIGILVGSRTDPLAPPHAIQPSSATIRASRVAHIDGAGIDVQGGNATIEDTHVHGITANDAYLGRAVRAVAIEGRTCSVSIARSLLEDAAGIALLVVDAAVKLDHSIVRKPSPGKLGYGDCVAVMGFVGAEPAKIDVTDSLLAHAPRAGLSNFGGTASLARSRIDCTAIDLDGESIDTDLQGKPAKPPNQATFADLGGNRCGCDATPRPCQVKSTHLNPPPTQF